MIELLYFAWVREKTGTGQERIALPAHVTDVATLLDWLTGRYPQALADRTRLRVAVNQTMASPETLVAPGDEVAIFPPVTGG